MDQFLPIVMIFLGEGIAIFAEIAAARSYAAEQYSFLNIFLRVIPVFIIGSALLTSGYMLGFQKLKSIWIVSACSITSILIIEPALAYILTGQLPTRGSLVGLIFGVCGFVSALFF